MLVFVTAGFLHAGAARAEGGLPAFREAKERLARSESLLLDRHGVLIQELRSDLRVRRLAWTPLAAISPALREAVISSEDRRFEAHHGVDWLGLVGAAREKLVGFGRNGGLRGASTITMQVAGLLDGRLRPRRLHRDWRQKLGQLRSALELEKSWTKDEILEAYLNLVFFRGELQGVASAARGLFGKSPNGLDREESMILAALIRSPAADPAAVARRACLFAEAAMAGVAASGDSCSRIRALTSGRGLTPRPFPPEVALAPHAARLLFKKAGDDGVREMRSTLDGRLQARVLEILRRHVLALRDRNMNDAAALVVDNRTGHVLAYVGGIGDLSSARAVDGVRASRQAGSTLKPFLYALALERRLLTASSRLDDSAADIPLGPGAVYRPRDFDHEFHGEDVTLRSALGSSLNVPAVRTLQLVGVGSLVELMGRLGFEDLKSEEHYGPSLALGTADVTLWELVNAYRTLANGGTTSGLTLVAEAALMPRSGPGLEAGSLPGRSRRRVLSPETAFIVSDILSDKSGRSLTFGLDSPMALRFWAAVKTGTSKDLRDNWCVGYTSRYTIGVWAGNFSGQPMWNVSGVSGAAPAWAEIVEAVHRAGGDSEPVAPPRLVRFGNEWYIPGTEPSALLADADARPFQGARIVYPVEGLMIARDPDIPPEHQRVFFEASHRNAALKWVLDGEELGRADADLPWQPGHPGSHELRLVSKSGRVLDQVRFSIRR